MISIFSVSNPSNCTALIANGQVTYTPLVGYLGADLFTYVIEDSFGHQATATVYVDEGRVRQGSLVSWGGGLFAGDCGYCNRQ